MKHIIIGTAGHVDHGKTALIKALTGIETDRLKEEKERGISIDLGFASLNMENCQAGIVDVPGHERFLKNMLAGTGGMDVALLIVAADEGVMAQTREHLKMLHLYGLQHGLIVITKVDKVEEEWLSLVEADVRNAVQGTFLEDAPLCHVSSTTGKGIEKLKEDLRLLVRKVPGRLADRPFRMWIDRVFTVKGHGVVATGTVLSGRLSAGSNLLLQPAGKSLRVRGLQCHGAQVEEVVAGQRAAVNLAGAERDKLARGMFLSEAGRGQVSEEWQIKIHWLESPPANGTRVRIHVGTGEYFGRIYSFKEEKAFWRLLLEAPLPGAAGDRGILRLYSPQTLLGSALLLEAGCKNKRFSGYLHDLAFGLETGCPRQVLSGLFASGATFTLEEAGEATGYFSLGEIEKGLRELENNGNILGLGDIYISKERLEAFLKEAKATLNAYHRLLPDEEGMPKELLRQKLGIKEKRLEAFLSYWLSRSELVMYEGKMALPSHAQAHSQWYDRKRDECCSLLEGAGIIDVNLQYIQEKIFLSPQQALRVFEGLQRQDLLCRVGSIHVYRKTIQYIVNLIQQHFGVTSTLTVAQLRDMLNTSRKVALLIMEYLDMNNYTERIGDERRPGLKIQELSENFFI